MATSMVSNWEVIPSCSYLRIKGWTVSPDGSNGVVAIHGQRIVSLGSWHHREGGGR
jgi:hypothetical protein